MKLLILIAAVKLESLSTAHTLRTAMIFQNNIKINYLHVLRTLFLF